MIRSFLTAHTHALRTQKAKPEGFRSSDFFVFAYAINQPSEMLLRCTARNCCVHANRCGVRIGVCAGANRRRQTPAHRVAATGYREPMLCLNSFVCISTSFQQFDQKLPIDLGKKLGARNVLARGTDRSIRSINGRRKQTNGLHRLPEGCQDQRPMHSPAVLSCPISLPLAKWR